MLQLNRQPLAGDLRTNVKDEFTQVVLKVHASKIFNNQKNNLILRIIQIKNPHFILVCDVDKPAVAMGTKGYWMSNNTECAKYLKSKKAYRRCMEEFRKKWKSYGRVAGRIALKDTDEEERREIGGILGKYFYDKDICFEFAEFEQGLQRTRFAPVNMKEVLEAYFGETLSTNQGEKQEWEKRKTAFLNGIKEHFLNSACDESAAFLWVQDLTFDKKYGYQQLMKEFKKEPQQAEVLAKNVGTALIQLERMGESGIEWPLAVFAAKISGNPHYFDRGTTPGQLRSVALELIPLILNSGADIYYSGDIDPDGIGIADRLWQKFGERVHIWRMSPEDYETSISKECIDNTGLAKLENVRNPLLKHTAEAVREKRRAAYQENLLEKLLGDILYMRKI